MNEFRDFSHKKVVYIDDNEMNLKVGLMTLKKFNIDSHRGIAMTDLFELMKTNEYDLIILDDMMPEMSGTEGMQKLKSEGYSKPIIVLTGNAAPEDRQKYLNAGFDEYLAKPINISELDRVLNLFL